MIPLPNWMSGEILEAWGEYVTQRIKDKKAMTPRSMVARIKRLQELKDAGHDPLHCLDEAINGHWLDFYCPKDKPIEAAAGSDADRTAKYLAEHTREPDPQAREKIAEIRSRLRRV